MEGEDGELGTLRLKGLAEEAYTKGNREGELQAGKKPGKVSFK